MSREAVDQKWARKPFLLKDMLSTVEERVVTLEESMGDVKERIDDVNDKITDGLQSMEQSKDYVMMSLRSNVERVQELLYSHRNKLTERNNALEVMVMALKEETMTMTKALNTRIGELEGELVVRRVVVSKGVLCATLNREIDVSKLDKFKGARFARGVNNFLWEIEQYFHAIGINDDDAKVNIVARYFTDFNILWWQ